MLFRSDVNDYLFKGIASRAFTRSFAIDDQIEVKNAELFNGMLKIALERIVPEEKKPKKVPVKTKGQKQADIIRNDANKSVIDAADEILKRK